MGDLQRGQFNIHYETLGPPDGAPLVLIAGVGEQIGSVEFPEEQCALLADRGFRIVRLDNRDAGLSIPTPELDPPDLEGIAARTVSAPYTHLDMAADVVAVLDALAIEEAHVVGASMGGFVARWLAIEHAARVASLTVVMGGSGAAADEDGPQYDIPALWRLFSMTERIELAAAIEVMTELWRWMWGDGYPFDEAWVRGRVAQAVARSYRPEGIARQFMSSVRDQSLWERQAEIECPTLFLHGGQDPLGGPDHAEAAAARIPGAQLWVDPLMGHALHQEQWPEFTDRVAALAGLT